MNSTRGETANRTAGRGAGPKRNGKLDEHIHRQTCGAIIGHKLSPGRALQEGSLALAFGVSRTVIRKVLHRLPMKKLVDLVPSKVATVARPSAEEARQVFEARRVLESVLIDGIVGSVALSGGSSDLLNDDRVKAFYLGGEL